MSTALSVFDFAFLALATALFFRPAIIFIFRVPPASPSFQPTFSSFLFFSVVFFGIFCLYFFSAARHFRFRYGIGTRRPDSVSDACAGNRALGSGAVRLINACIDGIRTPIQLTHTDTHA